VRLLPRLEILPHLGQVCSSDAGRRAGAGVAAEVGLGLRDSINRQEYNVAEEGTQGFLIRTEPPGQESYIQVPMPLNNKTDLYYAEP
jgi:hypothetical protein